MESIIIVLCLAAVVGLVVWKRSKKDSGAGRSGGSFDRNPDVKDRLK